MSLCVRVILSEPLFAAASRPQSGGEQPCGFGILPPSPPVTMFSSTGSVTTLIAVVEPGGSNVAQSRTAAAVLE